jgi:hypothetical protein
MYFCNIFSLKQHLFEQQHASPTTSLLLARFALIQHRGKEACNTHRHDAILVTIAHAPELISEELIGILKRACRDSMEGILMETLNTMIACKVHGAVSFFRCCHVKLTFRGGHFRFNVTSCLRLHNLSARSAHHCQTKRRRFVWLFYRRNSIRFILGLEVLVGHEFVHSVSYEFRKKVRKQYADLKYAKDALFEVDDSLSLLSPSNFTPICFL